MSGGFPTGAFLANLAITFGLVALTMAAAMLVAIRRGRHDGIDVVWGLGFVVVALGTLAASAGDGPVYRRVLVTVLVTLWGGRLAIHIGRRNAGKPEDKRYVELMERAPGNPTWYAFRKIYLIQGAVLWFVSFPAQAAQYGYGGAGWLIDIGVLVWVVGFVFETVGDQQLARFTADPDNKGKVMDRGLWHYTRHPNYFGDACVWWGLYLTACHHWAGAFTVLSPAVMTFTLVRGTGKALLERTIGSRRSGYAEYVRRTSGFFPLPPRKEGSREAGRHG
jgi:steroid 5-alpha reductase family enzyme